MRMIRYIRLLIAAGLLMVSTVHAKDYPFSISICEVGSSCKTCVDDIQLILIADMATKSIVAFGKAPSGENVRQRLANCSFQSEEDWNCRDFRGLVTATNGTLNYSQEKQDLQIDEKRVEICVR